MRKGRLIVIEGLDGSGKATQSGLLAEYLRKTDKHVMKISFPDYEKPSSTLVRMYLNGEVGDLNDVNVYAASSFYAADRYISFVTDWKKQYESGYTIIADRYSTSNVTHQMSKLQKSEWDGYLGWLDDYEYVKMGLPRPDKVIYLDMPPEISRKLIEQRYGGDDGRRDIHERDFGYLQACRKAALYAAKRLGWIVVSCGDGEPFSIERISEKIREISDKG